MVTGIKEGSIHDASSDFCRTVNEAVEKLGEVVVAKIFDVNTHTVKRWQDRVPAIPASEREYIILTLQERLSRIAK